MKKCASKSADRLLDGATPPGLSLLICILCFGLTMQAGFAGSATWQLDPISGDWNTAANWMPNTVPNGPSDTATFAASNMTEVALSSNVDVNGIVFDTGASAFSITTPPSLRLRVSGTGITNNSGVVQQFVLTAEDALFGDRGTMRFTNAASAGELTTYTNAHGIIGFLDSASAAGATFVNEGNQTLGWVGVTFFSGDSSAGNATFYNNGSAAAFHYGGMTNFYDSSTAANGNFIIDGAVAAEGFGAVVEFLNTSTAGNATFTVNGGEPSFFGDGGGQLGFVDSATADNCTIIANGSDVGGNGAFIVFQDQPGSHHSMGNATIILNGGATTPSEPDTLTSGSTLQVGPASTDGGTARVAIYDNAHMYLFDCCSGGSSLTIGSLEGNGRVDLVDSGLTIGSNNLSTTFAGRIKGYAGLTKIGSGTLTLSGGSTYSGGTIVEAGVLEVANRSVSATGSGSVVVKGGTLAGNGVITGGVDVGGEGLAAFLAPGQAAGGSGGLNIAGALSFHADATYVWNVQPAAAMFDHVIANGVVIDQDALFSAVALDNGVLPVGTILRAINNTSASPISGTFANLPDGTIVTVGANNYQAGYEGGDGNDLTLTVVE
jgi:autotransporter-associated beta strand protein